MTPFDNAAPAADPNDAFRAGYNAAAESDEAKRNAAIAAEVDYRASLPHFHSDYNGKHSAKSIIREAEARLKADGK